MTRLAKRFDIQHPRGDGKLALLRSVPWLEGAATKELTALARVVEVVDAPAGRLLVAHGQVPKFIYIVVSGSVARGDVSGAFEAGDLIAAAEGLTKAPSAYSATSSSVVTVAVMTRAAFRGHVESSPWFARCVAACLAERVVVLERRSSVRPYYSRPAYALD